MPAIDSNTTLLLHCDGADGSTTFTDSSPVTKTVTAQDNAQVDTAQYKFGGASCLLDGSGDYLLVTNDNEFKVGTNDFTYDMWVRFNATTAGVRLVDWTTGASYLQELVFSGTSLDYYELNVLKATGSWSPSTGVWYHVALVRSGTDVYLFVNGTQVGSTGSSNTNITSTDNLAIGAIAGGTNSFNGWLDEIRFSNVARWTSNFTPYSSAYGQSNTNFLMVM